MKYSTNGQFNENDQEEMKNKLMSKYGPEEQDSEYDQDYLDKKRAE